MPLSMDPQILAALTPYGRRAGAAPGDVASRRSSVSRLIDRDRSAAALEVLAPEAAVSRLAIAARVRRLRVPDPQ